jgi:DNA-directed RNA polymerase
VEDAKASGLLPRVIHSIDAYIMRQLVIRMNKLGIIVVPNHDSFLFSREYEATVTGAVKELLVEVMEGEVLSSIVKQLNKANKTLNVKTADGRVITADMFGEQLTKEDIIAGTPMASEEL